MRGTLLIVDSTGHTRPLIEQLEARGFTCRSVRGPLRLRATLEAGAVDAIVWNEGYSPAGLQQDLFREWSRFPHVPVIHLFSNAVPAHSPPWPVQVVESLPIEGCEHFLPALLLDWLEHPQGTFCPDPAEHTELAFRNVLQTLRERRAGMPDAPDSQSQGGFPAPNTALKAAERVLLDTASNGENQDSDATSHVRRLRRLLGRKPSKR